MELYSRVPSHFTSAEEIFPTRQRVDCLWLVGRGELHPSSTQVNQVYASQTPPIYKSVMLWGKRLKWTGSVTLLVKMDNTALCHVPVVTVVH
jgi:hypothetical protein